LYFLGRPWGNSNGSVTSNTKVLFSNTLMSNSINPLGWTKWDATTDTSVITYAEFKSKNLDGTLTDVSKRVSWSKQFANADTVGYNIPTMFSGWNPCSVRADFCNYAAPEIAVSNFKATKTTSNAKFTWNISWAMNGIQYDVYRSIDNKASYQLLNSVTATNDTNINFNSSDVLPPSCTSYFYFVKASKTGYATNYTDTIEVSSSPAINLNTTSLNSFLQGSTAASNSQSFIVNANNLSTNVTVTPPANFEVSTDNATWVANPSTITLTPTAGAIANTTIYVRLNAATPNTYTGNIVFATNCSSNTITKSIAVNGTTLNIPLQQYSVIEQWNLTAHNGVDSLITDTFNIEPVNSKLNKLYVSNGTQVSTIPAYSTQFGQAFGATANGDGTWSTGSGGPGSTLNRNYYEEF
ncbi:hypothetical protein EBX93_17365, partial [bacterium]|nr:hypothetical protein [bacterium]